MMYYLTHFKSQTKQFLGLEAPAPEDAQLIALSEIAGYSRGSYASIVQTPITNMAKNEIKKLICIRALCDFFHIALPATFPTGAVNLLQDAIYKANVGIHLAWDEDRHLPFNDIVQVIDFAFEQEIFAAHDFYLLHGLMQRCLHNNELEHANENDRTRNREQLHIILQMNMVKLHAAFANYMTRLNLQNPAPRTAIA